MSCLSRILIPLTALLPLTSLHAQQNLDSAFPDLATLKNYRTMRASSSDPNWRNGNGDARPIPPGGTLTLAEVSGPGEIAHIWFTISDRERGYPRLLMLRMYWDGEKTPSVECPVGDFFGIGHGMDVPFDSLPVARQFQRQGPQLLLADAVSQVSPHYRHQRRPRALQTHSTITSTGASCRASAVTRVIFMRCIGRNSPPSPGRNYLIADIVGRGHYVGTVMNCKNVRRFRQRMCKSFDSEGQKKSVGVGLFKSRQLTPANPLRRHHNPPRRLTTENRSKAMSAAP